MSLIAYVTLAQAKQHVQVDDSYHDEYLQHLIYAASAAVKNHLGDNSAYRAALDDDDEPAYDSNYEPVLADLSGMTQDERARPEVKHAVLLLVGEWFRNREGEGGGYDAAGYLPRPVQALLYPLRDPTAR